MTRVHEIELAYADMWRELGCTPVQDLNVAKQEAMCVYLVAEYKKGKYRLMPVENGTALDLLQTPHKRTALNWLAMEIATTVTTRDLNKRRAKGKKVSHDDWLNYQAEILKKLRPVIDKYVKAK